MPVLSDLPDSIKHVSIGEFILPNVPKVDLNAPLSGALTEYKESPYPVLLVVDNNGSLVGMITDNDLVGRSGVGTVAAILPKEPVIAVRRDATLSELLEVMNGLNRQKRVLDRVPVVDPQDNNKPLGIVDRDKLTIRLGEMFAVEASKTA